MHQLLTQPAIAVLLTMVTIAAVSDFRTGLIPNAVAGVGAVAAVLVQLLFVLTGQTEPARALADLALGLLAGGLVPLVLYNYGALGGGDVKLFAAIGLCVGPLRTLDVLLWSHLIALAFVPVQLLRQGRLLSSLRISAKIFGNVFLPPRRRWPIDRAQLTSLRFAPAILGAVVWVCLLGAGQS